MLRTGALQASRENVDSAQPCKDTLSQHLTADAVAIMQGGQGARVEILVGQSGQLEARGLYPMAQQRAGHRFTQTAHDRMVLGYDHQAMLVANRFEDGSSLLRIVTALVILVFFTVYCASGVVAGARLFESMFGMDYQTALWVGAVATMAYVFIGGFLAVSWTDTVQASLMIFALIVTPFAVMMACGGIDPTMIAIQAKNSEAFNLFKGTSVDGVYDADPKKVATATRYDRVSFDRVLSDNLKVMDAAAFALCQENKMPIVVFDFFKPHNLRRVMLGEEIGTLVTG